MRGRFALCILAGALLLVGASGCRKWLGRARIEVVRAADMRHHAVVTRYCDQLYSIDTSTFQIGAHLQGFNMWFDVVERTADGGLIIASRRGSRRGPFLFSLDSHGAVRRSDVGGGACYSPRMGQRYFAVRTGPHPEREFSDPLMQALHLYDPFTLELVKRYEIETDLITRDRIWADGGNFYVTSYDILGKKRSGVVRISEATLQADYFALPFLEGSVGNVSRLAVGDTLISFDIYARRLLLYSMEQQAVLRDTSYAEALAPEMPNYATLKSLKATGEHFYLIFVCSDAGRTTLWVKVRRADMAVVEKRAIEWNAPIIWRGGSSYSIWGRFFVILCEGEQYMQDAHVLFVDWRTGEIAGRTELPPVHYRKGLFDS